MSGMLDGVSTVWTLNVGLGGRGIDIHGFKTDEEAALQLFMNGWWKKSPEELHEHVAKFKAAIDKRVEDALHEHEWVDSVEGDEVVGQHCETCGQPKET